MPHQLAALFMTFLSVLSLGCETLTGAMSLGGNLMLVNRGYMLSPDYEPDDLVQPNVAHTSSAILMRAEAAEALEALFAAAKEEAGYTLYAHSGYRSYDTQDMIYQRKIKNSKNLAEARLLVADPGASEHQLGLAMDVKNSKNGSLSAAFGRSKEGIWLAENAYRFGFIIRYKAEWTDITGYAYEPWHIRYVGKEHAQILYEMDIPLEEYIGTLRSIAMDEYLKGDTP